MGQYKVKKNESLSSIAHDHHFNRWQTLLNATNEKWPGRITNPDVIAEGMTIMIPEKKAKKVGQPDGTFSKYNLREKGKQILRLRIKDSFNEIKSVKNDIKLKINGGEAMIKDETNYYARPFKFKTISTANPLPDGMITNSSLELNLTLSHGNKIKKTIKLEVGGLDPLAAPDAKKDGKPTDHIQAKKSVQKILKNQGYYYGEIDGDLDKEESVRALGTIQMQKGLHNEKYGKPTSNTLTHLRVANGISLDQQPIKHDKAISKSVISKTPLFTGEGMGIYNFTPLGQGWKQKPLGKAKEFGAESEVVAKVGKIQFYRERHKDWHKSHIPEHKWGPVPLLNPSDTCYVAAMPASCSEVNIIREDRKEFIFLDVGRWKNTARDFGLVYGRNVYLCSYGTTNGISFADKDSYRDGLDLNFFRGFNKSGSTAIRKINIQSFAYMNWGEEEHYDWNSIHIILPDMHLMSPEVSHTWYRVLDKDGTGHVFLKAERDLFDFVTDLTDRIKGLELDKVHVTNLGDVYDLWVGMGVTDTVRSSTAYDDWKKAVTDFEKMQKEFSNQGLLTSLTDLLAPTPAFIRLEAAKKRVKDAEHLFTEMNFPLFRWKDDDGKPLKDERMIIEDKPGYFFYNMNGKSYEATIVNKHNFIFEGLMDIQKVMKSHLTTQSLSDWFDRNKDGVNKYKGTRGRDYENSWTYLNPAEAALRKLEDKFNNRMTFIYGNHDSYLADEKFTKKANIKKRESWFRPDGKALFIEHGQRLEAFFLNKKKEYDLKLCTAAEIGVLVKRANSIKELLSDKYDYFTYKNPVPGYFLHTVHTVLSPLLDTLSKSAEGWGLIGEVAGVSPEKIVHMFKYDAPTNEDGNRGGFKATCDVYNAELKNSDSTGENFTRTENYMLADVADDIAGTHDQRIYRKEFAKYWLGEKSNGNIPPSLFVIGHTHMPELIHVKIESEDFDLEVQKKNKDYLDKQEDAAREEMNKRHVAEEEFKIESKRNEPPLSTGMEGSE
jgi:LysM domain